MSRVGNQRASQVELTIPQWGGWRAEVVLEGDEPPTGQVTLTVGGMALTGTVQRGSVEFPGKPAVVIRGGIGWLSDVSAPISFQSDAGVRLSTVLSAISRAARQTIEQPTDSTIGGYFEAIASRPSSRVTYKDLLDRMVRDGSVSNWRVDPDGVTRFGARTGAPVTDRYTFVRRNPSTGSRVFAIDDPKQILPGNLIDGVAIVRAVIRESHDEITAEVFEDSSPPSIADQIRALVASAFDDAVRTYVVAACHGDGRLDLVPPPNCTYYPEMRNVEQWSLGGCVYKASAGDEAAVVFLDSNRTRPIVIGFKLTSDTVQDVARKGDTVKILLPPMVFNGTVGGAPASGILASMVGSTLGTIDTGSSKIGAAT